MSVVDQSGASQSCAGAHFAAGIRLEQHRLVDADAVDLPSKLTYKGMMLEDVPNLALAIGYTNASWTLKAELTCQYVCRILNHLRDTGMRQATPRNRDARRDSPLRPAAKAPRVAMAAAPSDRERPQISESCAPSPAARPRPEPSW